MEVVGLLDSLASLCSKDSPSDLVALAFNRLKDGSSNSPQPPRGMWHVDTKPPVLVDCYPDVVPLLEDVSSAGFNELGGSSGRLETDASSGSLHQTEAGSGKSHKTKARSGSLKKIKAGSGSLSKREFRSDDLGKSDKTELDSIGGPYKTEPCEEGKESSSAGPGGPNLPPQPCTKIEVRWKGTRTFG